MSRQAVNRNESARRPQQPRSLLRLPAWRVLFFAERAEALAWVESVLSGRRQRRSDAARSAPFVGQ